MLKEEWAVIRREANEVINSPVVEEFRLVCEMYFEGALQGKGPFRRRPCVSLRLVCDMPVATKLVACPCGTVRHGEFVPHTDKVYCELLQEHHRIVEGEGMRKFTRRLTVTIKPEGASLGTITSSRTPVPSSPVRTATAVAAARGCGTNFHGHVGSARSACESSTGWLSRRPRGTAW
jgi:hypothetical protein